MKILVGAIIQESNTFSPLISTMGSFTSHVFFLGEQLREMKIENEIAGAFAAAQEDDVEVVPLLCASAVSGGVFDCGEYEKLKNLLRDLLAEASGYDGVFFAMHGAMVAEGQDDVEGDLTGLIRQYVGDGTPFVLTLDLHANITRKMMENVDAIVGYRTYPHVDFYETGYRGMQLLIRMLRGEVRPVMAMRKIPMIVPAENSQTMRGPFADLFMEAENGERNGNSIITSLFPVQPWLDIDEMGFAVTVVSDQRDKAQAEADRLAELAWNKRHEFDVRLYSVEEVVRLTLERGRGEGPSIISDSADSPGAGATSDGTSVLRDLLTLGVQDKLTCFLYMTDAPAVAIAADKGVGQSVRLTVGHTLNREHGQPLTIEGDVWAVGDGRFWLDGGYAKNTEMNMGRCVVIRMGRIFLLIGERPVFSGDPAMYRSVKLEPEQADIVMVKSANQFRAGYESISKHIYILDTPGCSTANLKSLAFRKLPRPFYPFDDNFSWKER